MEKDNDIEIINNSNDSKNKKNNNTRNIDNPIFCPICNNNLSGFSENVIQSHVNRCLDGPTLIQKRNYFSNKVQSSITSYINVSSPTKKYMNSIIKTSYESDSKIEKDSKYFNKSSKKDSNIQKNKSIPKLKSFNENLIKNDISKNSNKSLTNTKSNNEISTRNSNVLLSDIEGENIFLEKSSLLEKSSEVTNNISILNTKTSTVMKNKYLNKNHIFDEKNNNSKLNIPTENILNIEKDKKKYSEISIPLILEDISNSEEEKEERCNNEEKNEKMKVNYSEKYIPFIIEDIDDCEKDKNNIDEKKDKMNKHNNNESDFPFNMESIVNNETVMSFDFDDTINNDFDNQNTINDVKLERSNSDIPINDLSIKEHKDLSDHSNKNSDENKKRKRKEKPPKSTRKRKLCPYFKKVQNTTFVVDAFTYGKIENCTSYFLSHFHSDHYGGITKKYDYGPIYCSKVTANLLIELIGVNEQFVHPLELDKEYIIEGVKVTLIDANHCPGAVIFLFSVPIGNNQYFNALHTGDFRANNNQLMHPAIQGLKNSFLDILYLDTTYLQPEHIFPSQEVVINSVLDVLKNIVFEGKTIKEYNNIEKKRKLNNEYKGGLLRYFNHGKNDKDDNIINCEINENINTQYINNNVYNKKKVLVLVGTYLIGKEKVFVSIAKYLKSKIYASNKKKKILECLNDETISNLLTSNPDEANVHVLNMGQLGIESVNNYYNIYKDKYDMVIAFRPTGWVFKPKKSSKRQLEPDSKKILEEVNNLKLKPTYYNRNISIWGIPYSEHSSYLELENFIRVLSSLAQIRNIQPTVNVKSFSKQNEECKKYWYWFDTWRQNPIYM
ncbi:DRMBL-domain-containing protein [Piromyces finnis]|uniref:DRMBL-domain-containing protein n=1 Tax=Piromyces finnis TaxID=1754191 RepID=A0A1Y1VF49_9FUNG|nr:DRMBL-domain-containing protein [Piromyces finnis]|eukprot:ORX54688.1 DRMBL-domain-containing protein [Piromyces finnis]